MYLAGDIGGTKTHLALYEKENGSLTCTSHKHCSKSEQTVIPDGTELFDGKVNKPCRENVLNPDGMTDAQNCPVVCEKCRLKCLKDKKYPSQDYPNLETILEAFLKDVKKEGIKACFGIAGPIVEKKSKATNLPWIVDAEKIQSAFKFKNVFILNDLETTSYGINMLSSSDLYILNKGIAGAKGNKAVVAAGTGLGEAGIYFDGKEDHPFACEGGHCDFSPNNLLEIELLKYLMEKFGHVSYERVLSGQGIENIYAFLRDTKVITPEKELEEEMQAQVISNKALSKSSAICEKTLEMFVSFYGAEVGNAALKFYALGGIYIGGGIAPKILNLLKEDIFMNAFLSKGRFKGLLEKIPVWVILNENTSLLGALYFVVSRS